MNNNDILELRNNPHKAKEFFLNHLAFTTSPDRLNAMMQKHLEDFNLFDFRDYDDYIKAHIPYAIHIPFDQLEEQMVKFTRDKVNVLYSYSPLCQLANKVAYILADKGYPVMVLTCGFKGWKKRDFQTVEDDMPDYPG